MLIGFDGTPLGELKTGVGHYTFELARQLASLHPADQFVAVSHRQYVPAATDRFTDGLPNLHLSYIPVSRWTRHWWVVGLPSHLKRNAFTLFHGTNYDIPLRGDCPSVLTIHDLSTFVHPQTHEKVAVRRNRYRLPLMARKATMIITPTESVRAEVCERFRTSPPKVVAIGEAAREIFQRQSPERAMRTRARLGINDRFLLCVGTLEPRKNLPVLLQAYELLAARLEAFAGGEKMRAPQLVLTGRKGWLTNELTDMLQNSPVRERIHFTGYVTDEDLRDLYSSCLMMIYPSLYEGFGLPPLEAMACGAPVLASRIPAITEVVSDGKSARLFDPTRADDLSAAMLELLENPQARDALGAAGLQRARSFSWQQAARSTYEVYLEALRRKRV